MKAIQNIPMHGEEVDNLTIPEAERDEVEEALEELSFFNRSRIEPGLAFSGPSATGVNANYVAKTTQQAIT